jgi:protein involved in polysaccharide export with SLBB domain
MQNAYIIRSLDNDDKIYLRINLAEAMANKNSEQNVLLMPRDQIRIYSLKDFVQNSSISVIGAVKNTGEFNFVRGMTLADALRNAGGFKIEAENLRIEISRLSYFSANYKDGQDVRVIIEKLRVDSFKNFLNDEKAQFLLQPYDQVFVRTVPNFDFQQNITVAGEVKYPGVYSLLSKDERISDIINRSGGLTRFAFTEGATLFRPELPGGYIVLKLDNALFRKGSRYNYVLKEGDRLNIPTITDFISIKGTAIQYIEVTDRAQVNAPFHSGRRAKFYINKFGNGFSKEAWRKKTYVIQPNAKINRTKNFVIFKVYPKVTKGSTIYVVQKEVKPEEIKKEREPFNWNKFVESTTLKVTGLATLFILLRQL